MERKLVTVAVDGSAEFTTLTAAAAAQDPAQPLHFVLGAGTYYERPFLELADYIITGAGMGQTVISAGAAGRDPWPGEERTRYLSQPDAFPWRRQRPAGAPDRGKHRR